MGIAELMVTIMQKKMLHPDLSSSKMITYGVDAKGKLNPQSFQSLVDAAPDPVDTTDPTLVMDIKELMDTIVQKKMMPPDTSLRKMITYGSRNHLYQLVFQDQVKVTPTKK